MSSNSIRTGPAGAWIRLGLALLLPVAAKADLSETIVLQVDSTLNMDTGAIGASGGDILYNKLGLTPQGSAKAKALGTPGYNYPGVVEASLQLSVASASSAAIPASSLTNGKVFLVVTNSGKLAKGLIISDLGPVIWIEFTTYGATPPAGQPFVSGVVNNSSGIPFGYSNSGITPSGLIAITGSNLSDPGDPVLQSSAAPGLPLTLNGTSVAITVNNVTTHPALYYTSPGQVAAVVPAATPLGNGFLTVTYRGQTSAPSPVMVVAAAVGINPYNGLGVVTDAITGALLYYTNSGTPNEAITIWSTGLGADPADSDSVYASSPHAVNTPMQLYIGNIQAQILYQGSAGYPGVNQINAVIPPGVTPGCWVSITAVTNGIVSASVAIPVQPGGGECKDVESGATGSQINPPSEARSGLVGLLHAEMQSKSAPISNSASAAFEKYSGVFIPSNNVSPGGCIFYPPPPPNVVTVTPGLDAGAITLTGPGGLNVKLTQIAKGTSTALLSTTAIPASGGVFTFQGAGGADIGKFTLTMNLSPLMQWTNQSAAVNVDRSQDLPIQWTGGNADSYLLITGTSIAPLAIEQYQCKVPASGPPFAVPSYLLQALPAGTKGATIVQDDMWFPLPAAPLDIATAGAAASYEVDTTYAVSAPR